MCVCVCVCVYKHHFMLHLVLKLYKSSESMHNVNTEAHASIFARFITNVDLFNTALRSLRSEYYSHGINKSPCPTTYTCTLLIESLRLKIKLCLCWAFNLTVLVIKIMSFGTKNIKMHPFASYKHAMMGLFSTQYLNLIKHAKLWSNLRT